MPSNQSEVGQLPLSFQSHIQFAIIVDPRLLAAGQGRKAQHHTCVYVLNCCAYTIDRLDGRALL